MNSAVSYQLSAASNIEQVLENKMKFTTAEKLKADRTIYGLQNSR